MGQKLLCYMLCSWLTEISGKLGESREMLASCSIDESLTVHWSSYAEAEPWWGYHPNGEKTTCGTENAFKKCHISTVASDNISTLDSLYNSPRKP